MKRVLVSLYHYACFFLFMAFLITCCMLLFLSTLSQTMGIAFTEDNINSAAIVTFGNVVFLSLICTLVDAIRRKYTIERPVKRIVLAAEKIAKGDYSVRIPAPHILGRESGLTEIADCYNKMAEALSATENMQADFIANVSHELKTPLAVIKNNATLVMQPDLSPEDRKYYATSISDACRRLSALITNILKLNKLENTCITPACEIFDLGAQIPECLLQFEPVWEEKAINIETRIEENVLVSSDPELMSLVWNNLISNALKFTSPGGTVGVTAERQGSFAVVSVKDTGCGITKDVGKRIFDKFYQGDPSHATEGNGLGLALVRRVVDLTGGEISVVSEKGKGSVFTVKMKAYEQHS